MKTKNAKTKEAPKEKAAQAQNAPAAPAPSVAPVAPQQAPAGQVQDLQRAAAPVVSKPKGRLPDMNLYVPLERGDKRPWPKVGVGWRNSTGTLSFRLMSGVALKENSTLFARDVERKQERSNERGA